MQFPYWNIRKFLILWLRSAIFSEWVFHFSSLEILSWISFIFRVRKFYFLKYKSSIFPKFTSSFPLRKYKKFFQGFCFLKYKTFSRGGFSLFFSLGWKVHSKKYKKSFLLRKYKISLILELESSISWIIRNFFRGGFFFNFLSLY